MTAPARAPTVAFTFDLHDVDLPEDIVHAAGWFRDAGSVATFFVPSAMLEAPRYRDALLGIPRLGHEVGSHGHHHDWREIDALTAGGGAELRFLAESRDRHAEFFGEAPTAFRSPRWCPLGKAAIRELGGLGYLADSSATPQRLPLLSSRPFHPGWWWHRRRVHALAPGLVEVPVSTFLLPAGAPTFLTFRRTGTRAFLALLEFEARVRPWRPIVLQFHVEDFNPRSRRDRGPARIRWDDFLPNPRGGFGIKVLFRDRDPGRIVANHDGIVGRFAGAARRTVTAIAREELDRLSRGAPG